MSNSSPELDRRRFLAALSAAVLAGGARPASAQTRSSAHVVIIGGGAAGTSMAARLLRLVDGLKVTILGEAGQHIYQPGLTLVAAGVWGAGQVVEAQSRWIPRGAEWIAHNAAEIDPVAKVVVTEDGKRIGYDFLVVAPGLELNFGAIEGFDPSSIGTNGIGCVYAGPEAALGTHRMMAAFAEKGGDALMTLAHTPIKCAGAPLKMTFILDDRLRRAGARGKAKLRFHSPSGAVFGVPVVNQRVLGQWKERDIGVELGQRLKAVDAGRRRATFTTREGDREVPFDFLHVVPPMWAPKVVRDSALAIREGALAEGGWLEVDKDTLRHRRFPEVFGCGDVNGTPRGKTAATVKKGGIVAAANLAAVIAGREPALRFDGYTSCPMVTSLGRAMLIEFDYEGRLTPTLPGVDPLAESWFAWFLEERMLKPAYFAMLKGWT